MFVLYQVANQKTAIQSSDGCAYLRILGSFPTRELANRHLRKIGDDYEIRIAPTDTWRLLVNRPYDSGIHEYEGQKYEKLIELHSITREKKEAAVQKHFEEKSLGQIDTSSMFEKKSIVDFPRSNHQDVPKVPGQNYAVLAIVPDYENKIAYEQKLNKYVPEAENSYNHAVKCLRNECIRNGGTVGEASLLEPPNKSEFMKEYSKLCDTSEIAGDEPMVQFLGCFETESEAKEFLDKLQQVGILKEYSKACVNMYEFFKVRHIESSEIQRYYQDETTQQLMDAFFKARKLAKTVA